MTNDGEPKIESSTEQRPLSRKAMALIMIGAAVLLTSAKYLMEIAHPDRSGPPNIPTHTKTPK